MQHRILRTTLLGLALIACGEEDAGPTSPAADPELASLEALGEELFFDTALSFDQTQSCATCHEPERAFIDPRVDVAGEILPVSRGDDGVSFGRRNAPSVAYAAFTPAFGVGTRNRFNKQSQHRLYEGPLGGFFHDGRALSLEEQAGIPPLSSVEMGMPSEAAVVERLAVNPRYRASFEFLFGDDVFDDPLPAYAAMTASIAAFERTEDVSPFDSRYDRALRGEVTLSFKELTGRALFFSEFTNCAICHQLHSNGDPVAKFEETFTGYEFHNLGIPSNPEVATLSGDSSPDRGLGTRTGFDDGSQLGKFKTPTLRNVAVTGPYMHNGVFSELRTVVEFYDRFNNPEQRALNPETGAPWREAEVSEGVQLELLEVGDPMTDLQVESMVCFLRTLTDARYEPLIEERGIGCAD